MDTILERYERYAYAEKMLTAPETETQASWTLESSKLKAKIEVLERNIRHYVGEDLEQLNLRELQYVEQQLETALKRIRTKKLKENEKNSEHQDSMLQMLQPHSVPSFATTSAPIFMGAAMREEELAQTHSVSTSMIPLWMIRHINQ
ncbi:putative transcription factor, K-box [Helianthus anomalus]